MRLTEYSENIVYKNQKKKENIFIKYKLNIIENCTYLASPVEESPQEILSISYLKMREEKKNLIRSVPGEGLPKELVCVLGRKAWKNQEKRKIPGN